MIGKIINTIIGLLLILLLSGCQALGLFSPTETPQPPTPTPQPPTELTICTKTEPESLYPYALSSRMAEYIAQTIYDGPIDNTNGESSPVILEVLPEFNSGTASFMIVPVKAGDRVINIYGQIVALQTGEQVYPSGCTSVSCAITWDGITDIDMDQPVATFQLLDGLTWSDGQALTASDSVYSFELASDDATPNDKTYVDRTSSYTIIDENTVQWVGLPGLATEDFENYFWMPLPAHAWGQYSAEELLTSEEVNNEPLGWGPYELDEWMSGSYMRLKKNDNYFKADENLPGYDYITFKFLPQDDNSQALDGTCDIVTDDAIDISQMDLDQAALSAAGFQLRASDSSEFEFLAFGITPSSYDDTYYPYGADRPDLFGDVNTRRAIALCIDRQAIFDELTGGIYSPANTYLQDENYLLSDLALTDYTYNPEQGKTLLEEIGWQDFDQNPETPLTMIATNTTVPFGTNFSITLHTSESAMRGLIAERIAADLAECGIEVNISQQPIQELYQPGPDGIIFSRSFDLALLSMNMGAELNCELFTTQEIPTEENYWLGTKTGGSNFMGYKNSTYDDYCGLAQSTGLDTGEFVTNAQYTLRILNDELPFIPFYHHPDFLIVKQGLNIAEEYDTLQKIIFSIENLVPNVQ